MGERLRNGRFRPFFAEKNRTGAAVGPYNNGRSKACFSDFLGCFQTYVNDKQVLHFFFFFFFFFLLQGYIGVWVGVILHFVQSGPERGAALL
jgi:hypothetical protein